MGLGNNQYATGGKYGAAVNQAELRIMAEERLKDAKALIDGSRWEFAYYAAGYAIECALKSCILARMIHTGWVFKEKVDAKSCLTHDFAILVEIADLRNELNAALQASAAAGGELAANWTTAGAWKVTSRYEAKTEAEARQLYAAIADEPHGC
jgi:HEPN domain-containing protein